MYIIPDTYVKLMADMPLDNKYIHTLFFDSKEQQTNFFLNYAKGSYEFNKVSYQRVNKNKIRLQRNEADLYNSNYMMFKNSAYSNKWFYAFVLETEYINDTTTEITYELDYMQTWFFEHNVTNVFALRQTSEYDNIGDSLTREPVDTGEIICEVLSKTSWFDNYSIIIALNKNVANELGFSYDFTDIVDGVYSGVAYIGADADESGAEQMSNLIDTLTENNKLDAIVNVFMFPYSFFGDKKLENYCYIVNNFDGYIPENNKLFTYPYKFVNVDNGNENANFTFENSKNTLNGTKRIHFISTVSMSPNPEIVTFPAEYNGSSGTGGNENDIPECITMTGFPQCAMAIDSYKAWLAQNGGYAGLGVTLAQDLLNLNFSGMINTVKQGVIETTHAQIKGSQGSQGSVTQVGQRLKDLRFRYMSVRKEYAIMIDDYFKRYGYAVNKIISDAKVMTRNHHTYVQTKNCDVHGFIPQSAKTKLESIYDNGVTFWSNVNEVGDYSILNKGKVN